MARILRGNILWADLNPTRGHEQAGRRPVLILSHEVFNTNSGTVIALAISSQAQRAGFPLTLEIPGGLQNKQAWVKISQIRTLSTERLGKKIGHLDEADVDRIFEGLADIVGPWSTASDTSEFVANRAMALVPPTPNIFMHEIKCPPQLLLLQ